MLDGARMRMARKPSALARELLRNFPKGKRRRGGRRREEAQARTGGRAVAGRRGARRRRAAAENGAAEDERADEWRAERTVEPGLEALTRGAREAGRTRSNADAVEPTIAGRRRTGVATHQGTSPERRRRATPVAPRRPVRRSRTAATGDNATHPSRLAQQVHLARVERDATVIGLDHQRAGVVDPGGDSPRRPTSAHAPALSASRSAPGRQHRARAARRATVERGEQRGEHGSRRRCSSPASAATSRSRELGRELVGASRSGRSRAPPSPPAGGPRSGCPRPCARRSRRRSAT